MARTNHITNSFVAGEASPRFFGRTETQQAQQACEELTNTLVLPQGGAARRGGSRYRAEITTSTGTFPTGTRCIPFSASDGTRWVLVLTTELPDAPGAFIPGVSTTPLPWMCYRVDEAYGALTRENIYYPATGTYLDFILGNYYNLTRTELRNLQYAQSGDTMILTCGTKKPFTIRYSPGVTGYRFEMRQYADPIEALIDSQRWKQVPYKTLVQGKVTESLKLVLNGSGVITVQPGTGSSILFDATWVGRYIKFTRTSNTAVVVMIHEFTSTTSLKGVAIAGSAPAFSTSVDYGGLTVAQYYEMSEWNDTDGWPRCVDFYDSRLILAGTKLHPDTMWFSQVNDIYEVAFPDLLPQETGFADPQVTSDAFKANLKQTTISEIRWISSGKTIVVGTSSREFICQGPDQSKSIGIDNFSSNGETPHGSLYTQAIRAENATIFMQRDGKKLREMVYNFNEDSYKCSNLNIVAEHMHFRGNRYFSGKEFEGVITPEQVPPFYARFMQMAHQETPHGIIWVLDALGGLAAITREREQNVAAWHYHYLGSGGFTPGGPITSICCLPVANKHDGDVVPGAENDILFMTVFRLLDGASDAHCYLESMESLYEEDSIAESRADLTVGTKYPVYMDCATTQEISAGGNGIIENLDYLGEGATVCAVANGIYLGEFTVSSDGEIDVTDEIPLDADFWITVGYPFKHRIIPMVPDVPATTGSAMARPRRIDLVTAHFYRSCAARMGRKVDPNQANTPPHLPDRVAFPEDASGLVELFTGDRAVDFPLGYATRPAVVIESNIPLPCEVTHIVSRMLVYE